jgi:hypothetical protein
MIAGLIRPPDGYVRPRQDMSGKGSDKSGEMELNAVEK